MSVSIVIPWRDLGCPHRKAAFDFACRHWLRFLPEEFIASPPQGWAGIGVVYVG